MTPKEKRKIEERRFHSFCVNVIISRSIDYKRTHWPQEDKEISFVYFDEDMIFSLYEDHTSPSASVTIPVFDMLVVVENEALGAALASMKDEDRLIILLSFFLKMSNARIAKLLHLNPDTVASRKKREIENLRKILEDYSLE